MERVVRDADGRLVRLSFCVYENGGHIRARLLNAVYLEEYREIENKIPVLTGFKLEKKYPIKVIFKNKIVSPYFNFDILYFSGSKPRAPTL